ncbi:hypothetical protein [Aliidongia dinghuensis]|nr:hypothetical protein [Aliidongia dinghuensis]
MIVWFQANHIPAQGPYFGFAEATQAQRAGAFGTPASNTMPFGSSASNTVPLGGVEIAGLDQGRFFDGGAAADLLKAEFARIVEEPLLTEVAGLFEGVWEVLPSEPPVDLETQTPAQRSETIIAALDDLAEAVRKLVPQHGGIGHNQPPEGDLALTQDDQRVILKASADARLAVLSSDYDAASLAWEATKPVFDNIASALCRHVDAFAKKYAETLAIPAALVTVDFIGVHLGLWDKALIVTTMLELLKHLH